MVVAQDVPQPRSLNPLRRSHRGWVDLVLTISKLKRWSINYYIDTAHAAETASRDAARAGGGLGEYYTEHETRTPTWLLVGESRTVARSVGLTDVQRAGGEADPKMVARWLDDGITPNGVQGRAFGQRGVHGFDLTFCAPKSVSLVRVLRGDDDVLSKAIADAHTAAITEAMEYLAVHAGYTRIHNPDSGEKDLAHLPGLAAIAYQHETSRCGDPHLHTHVIVPNRQARADGVMVSIDGMSLCGQRRRANARCGNSRLTRSSRQRCGPTSPIHGLSSDTPSHTSLHSGRPCSCAGTSPTWSPMFIGNPRTAPPIPQPSGLKKCGPKRPTWTAGTKGCWPQTGLAPPHFGSATCAL